jgi:hypothetical protein
VIWWSHVSALSSVRLETKLAITCLPGTLTVAPFFLWITWRFCPPLVILVCTLTGASFQRLGSKWEDYDSSTFLRPSLCLLRHMQAGQGISKSRRYFGVLLRKFVRWIVCIIFIYQCFLIRIMRSCMVYTLRPVLLGWSKQGGWDGRDMWRAWGRWGVHTTFWLGGLKGGDH